VAGILSVVLVCCTVFHFKAPFFVPLNNNVGDSSP
jgi:hypothetical protein